MLKTLVLYVLSSVYLAWNNMENVFSDVFASDERSRFYLKVMAVFILLVFIVLIYMYRKNKELLKSRKKLSHTNRKLQESNHIKEMYISHFLSQYSNHLDKVEEYKKHILRLLNTGHPNELIKMETKQVLDTKNDLNDFYADFDRTILELFPSFIRDINALLRRDQTYVEKSVHSKNRKLNTELRILALLRLGISDNKKIASFFRFTVQTVYNYRSKIRSKAIEEDTFEDDVRQICNYESD